MTYSSICLYPLERESKEVIDDSLFYIFLTLLKTHAHMRKSFISYPFSVSFFCELSLRKPLSLLQHCSFIASSSFLHSLNFITVLHVPVPTFRNDRKILYYSFFLLLLLFLLLLF